MTFAAPLFLTLLLPWAAVGVWLMWGRHSATRVPFIELWRGSVAKPSTSRQFHPPPMAIIAALSAMFLAIVAAAQPVVRTASPAAVVMIIDRGITMSAGDRLAGAMKEAEELVARKMPGARVEKINVPDVERSALDTREMLRSAVGSALQRTEGPVVVVSDQPVQDDPRVVQIAPVGAVENVGIVSFSIRERPSVKAMVQVRNDSTRGRAELVVDSVQRSIDLPPRGQTRNYFVDLPKVDATARAELIVEDDLDADNVAWLARQRDWPRIEIRPPVPAEVQRVAQAYQKARPAGDVGATITLGAANDSSVLVATGDSRAAQAVEVRDHRITGDIDWSKLKLRPIDQAPPPGFTPIVSAGSSPLISVIEQPTRRVHIAFDAGDFARTSEFVVLWTHILYWLADSGGETLIASAMDTLTPQWTPQDPGKPFHPGLYRRGDGAVAAFNGPAPVFPIPPPRRDAALATVLSTEHDNYNLLPWLVLASLACIALAAYAWPRQRLTPIFAARTV